jgi:uncharacterized phage protein (TIGR01671 family)
MREMLFRGKRKDNGEWVYGGFYGQDSADGPSTYYILHHDKLIAVDPKTVGQYTGFTDRNKVRIFEGDIVEDKFGNIGVISYSDHFLDWRIVFFKGREDLLDIAGACIFDWVYPEMTLKVIGNIHDSPELLGRE